MQTRPTILSPSFWRIVCLLMVTLIACGCSSYPLGLDKQEWQALSPGQQAEYSARQAKIDEQRRIAAEDRQLQGEQEKSQGQQVEK